MGLCWFNCCFFLEGVSGGLAPFRIEPFGFVPFLYVCWVWIFLGSVRSRPSTHQEGTMVWHYEDLSTHVSATTS